MFRNFLHTHIGFFFCKHIFSELICLHPQEVSDGIGLFKYVQLVWKNTCEKVREILHEMHAL